MPEIRDELFESVAEFSPRPVEWIWDGLIPAGHLTVLMGDPGVGKSFIAQHIAAMVTRGLRVPPGFSRDGEEAQTPKQLKSVAIVSTETAADTLSLE